MTTQPVEPVPAGRPDRLGRYQLHGVLGEGGMGVVHLGVDDSGRAAAVKVLRDHVAHDPDARARLAREVATLQRVDHPAVAPFLGADVDGPRPYIVTRYVGGEPLDRWIARHGPLHGPALGAFAITLADALDAIHAAGVVHRDLKPGNVLMHAGSPVVIDFGIAHVADDVRLTTTGLVMGTPGYLAPELLDDQAVTTATDLWGYAATVAFAATGRAPFGRGHTAGVLDRVRRADADLAGLDPRLAALLRDALAVDPARRPALTMLREALANPDLTTPVPTSTPSDPVAARTELVDPSPAMRLDRPPGGSSTRPTDPERGAPVADAAPPITWARDPSTERPHRREAMPAARGPRAEDAPTAAHARVDTRVMPAVRPADHPREVSSGDSRAHSAPYAGFGGAVHSAPPQGGAAAPAGSPVPPRPYHPSNPAPAGPNPTYPSAGSSALRPAGPPAEHVPPRPRSRRTGTLFAVGALLVALTGYLPAVGLLAAVGWSWLSRFVDRLLTALALRRHERGPRDRDVPLVVLASPLHLVSSAFSALVAGILPLLVGVAFALGLRALSGDVGGVILGTASTVMIGAAAAAIVGWWGPGSGTLRRGSRSVVRGLAPGRVGAIAVSVALVGIAVVLGLLTQASGYTLSWWPFEGLETSLPFIGW